MRTAWVSRYHALLVVLHRILAVLILLQLTGGFLALARLPNTDPNKISALRFHMAAGMLILALMAIRFGVRLFTAKPAPATTGSSALDRLAPLTHYGLYVIILLMATSGLATALAAGLNRIVFQGSGEPLPANFLGFPSFTGHVVLAFLLVALIALHFGAALYHQFIRRDGLLRRMGFGRRDVVQP